MTRWLAIMAFGVAITALSGYAQDRSGVITGGAIPSRQKDQQKAVEEQYKRLIATPKQTESTVSTAKQPETAVQLERPVEKAKPSETGSGTVPSVATAPVTDLRSPAPSLPQLAQLPPAPPSQDPFANPVPPSATAIVPTPISSEVTISGPAQAYIRVPTMLSVTGFSEAELRSASLFCEPRVGCSLRRLKDPTTGEDLLMFAASRAGSYTIIVGQNLQHADWEQHSEQLVASAAKANVTPELLAKLKAITTELSAAYPVKSGRHVLNVDDPTPIQPAPQPAPTPQPPPITPSPTPGPLQLGVVATIIIRINGTIRDDQTEVLSDLRQWSDQQPKSKVAVIEVTPENIGPNGEIDPRLAVYLAEIEKKGATQPYVFITRIKPDGDGGRLWDGPLPANADALITKIQQYVSGRPLIPLGNTK